MEETTTAAVPVAPVSEAPTAGTATEATAAVPSADTASEPAPPDGTAQADASAEATASESDTPEAKSRRDRQAEKRRQPTPPPPKAPTPEEIIQAYERNRQEQEKAERDRTERYQKNARFIGEDQVTVSGETISRYEQLRREASAIISDLPDYGYVSEEQFAAHREAIAKRNAAVAQFNELSERRQLIENDLTPVRQQATQQARAEAYQWLGDQFETAIGSRGLDAKSLIAPHLSKGDAAMPAILADLATAIEAPHLARIAELEDQHAADQSEIAAWKQRAGGQAAQPIRGGAAGAGGGVLTVDAYQRMSPEQRMALRSTPEGRAQIDAMTQRRAG